MVDGQAWVIPAGWLTEPLEKAKSPTTPPPADAVTLGAVTEVPVEVASEGVSIGDVASTPVKAPMPADAATGEEKEKE